MRLGLARGPSRRRPHDPSDCLLSPICRLAQEEAAPGPPAPPAPAATPAPAARAPAEEEVGPRRGEFTRLEYERRAQLKLMDDLDKVLRPRAAGTGGPGRGGRRAPRPRSGCCDDSALARSPARGLLGEDPVGWGLPAPFQAGGAAQREAEGCSENEEVWAEPAQGALLGWRRTPLGMSGAKGLPGGGGHPRAASAQPAGQSSCPQPWGKGVHLKGANGVRVSGRAAPTFPPQPAR